MKRLHDIKMGWYNLQIYLFGAWTFFCEQQKRMSRHLMHQYYNQKDNEQNKDVVFTCNGWIWHGGLADRIKGMIGVYDWCQQNGRVFRINFTHPFCLQDYLIPNQYDWIPQRISYDRRHTIPRVCLMEPRTSRHKDVLSRRDELIVSWLDDNLNFKQFQVHVYTNMFRQDVDYSKCFHELFKPCERLQKEIDGHLQNIGGKYISISFRFTTLLGDFTDCTGAPLPENEQKQLIERSLNVVHEIASYAPVHDKILITADSEKFLSRVMNVENVYVIPGKVGHIDYDHGEDVNMKTFLDFYMISEAEKVYLAKGPSMYNSAFAKTAAMVNNRPFEVFEYV